VDLGAALGTVAHLGALRRTAVGRLRVADAVSFETLQAQGASALKSMDSLLVDLPRLDLESGQAHQFLLGAAVPLEGKAAGTCRVYAGGGLLGVGRLAEGRLQPLRSVARG
jgi:tRNA pseudouridine55 synthase